MLFGRNRQFMLMNEDLMGSGGAGGGGTGDAGAGGAGGEGGGGAGSGEGGSAGSAGTGNAGAFTPPEWAKGTTVDPEILKAPMFSSVKTMDDVIKGYYHAQKMVGADKVVVPTKNSSPEEVKAFYQKVGLPEKFDDYKVELPKSFENKEFNDGLLKAAYENNINPTQLQKLTELFEKADEKIVADYEASQIAEIKANAESLRKEWGPGFAKQIDKANRVIKHFGGEEMHGVIAKSDLKNNTDFLRLMAKIGDKMSSEDSFQGGATETFSMTKAEAKSKSLAMYADPNGPYLNEQHAQHKEFVEKMLKYQEIMASNQLTQI